MILLSQLTGISWRAKNLSSIWRNYRRRRARLQLLNWSSLNLEANLYVSFSFFLEQVGFVRIFFYIQYSLILLWVDIDAWTTFIVGIHYLFQRILNFWLPYKHMLLVVLAELVLLLFRSPVCVGFFCYFCWSFAKSG